MEPEDPLDDLETRMSDAGDIEMFDGEQWLPLGGSVLSDDQVANRHGPDARPFPGTSEPADS